MTRPGGPLRLVSRKAAAGYGRECGARARTRSEVGVGGGGEQPVKSCEICPTNNQHLKSICSTSKRGERTTEECAEWAVTTRASKSISQTNTQQPECQRGEMAARDGNERDKNIILLSFFSPPSSF